MHYYRAVPDGLPAWIQQFVATGYSHYATLLPTAFEDRGTSPEQIAGMLGFIFTLESLALALGCQRSQLLIAIKQTGENTEDPAKLGLLWTAERLLNLRSVESIREFFTYVLANPLMTPAFPDYLNGFLLALNFTPRIASFVVELLSQVFSVAPDEMLMSWLPGLLLRLRSHPRLAQTLTKEASALYPASLQGFESWHVPWLPQEAAEKSETSVAAAELNAAETSIQRLLLATLGPTNALAALLKRQVRSSAFRPKNALKRERRVYTRISAQGDKGR